MNNIELAREAGFWQEHTDTWMCNTQDLERFAHLIREAVVQELVAGSGEPDGLWAYDENVMAWREYNREGFDSCTGAKLEAYSRYQLAGAVLREKERCAKVCEAYIAEGIGREMAAAIRSNDGRA